MDDHANALVVVAQSGLRAADAPAGDDWRAHLARQVHEEPVRRLRRVVREEVGDELLRVLHASGLGATELLHREAELRHRTLAIVPRLRFHDEPSVRRPNLRATRE